MTEYLEIYITEISKYYICAFIALYVLVSYLALLKKNQNDDRQGVYFLQNIIMFMMHFTCFLSICFETGKTEYLTFYAFQQIGLLIIILLFRLLYPTSSKLLLNNMAMMLSIGFIILTRLSFDKAIKQFFIVCFCAIVLLVIPFFFAKFHFLRELKWIYMFCGLGMIGAVLVLGAVIYGAKLSYTIGGVTFQPSELVKVLFILYLASALWKKASLSTISKATIVAGAYVMILVASKDLGSALIFFMVFLCMIYVASGKIFYFAAGIMAGAIASFFAFQIFTHVQTRVQAWKDPWSVIDDGGYQITQSLFAISSGGLFGLGLFQGSPQTIPFVEADFIFSAIVEEMGIVFGVCLLMICLHSFILLMRLAIILKDKFYQLLCVGIAVVYIFQVFLTVGGGTKFIPMTGVTLPFISYGGSSVLTSILLFYIAQGAFIAKGIEDKEDEEKEEYESIEFDGE